MRVTGATEVVVVFVTEVVEVCVTEEVAVLVTVLVVVPQETAVASMANSKTALTIKMNVRVTFDRLFSIFLSLLFKLTNSTFKVQTGGLNASYELYL